MLRNDEKALLPQCLLVFAPGPRSQEEQRRRSRSSISSDGYNMTEIVVIATTKHKGVGMLKQYQEAAGPVSRASHKGLPA